MDGRDADMTKMLLRLCVYIYKGLTLISKYTSRGIKVILRLFIKENISDLSKKTKDIISKEKKKQERIALIEEQRLKREKTT